MTDVHMRNTDAFSWYMEHDPGLRSTIVTVLGLDRPPDRVRLEARLRHLLVDLPMFRQVVVEPPLRLATPRWTLAGEVDLGWHLRWDRLDAWDAVLALARRDAMTAFDPAHPLWKATIVELADGSAAVVMKLHHALTDGVGGMQLALLLFDERRRVPVDPPVELTDDGEHLDSFGVVSDALAADAGRLLQNVTRAARGAVPAAVRALRDPVGAVRDASELAASVVRMVRPVAHPGSPIVLERGLGRHLGHVEIPLRSLQAAGRRSSGTVNDAFMAGIARGLRRYHAHHGSPLVEMRVTLPINVRTHEDPIGGNRITLQRIVIPIEDDLTEQMRAAHRACRQAQEEPAVPHTDAIAASLNLLPSGYLGSILKHVDVLASNVPGFRQRVYLAGAELRSYHAFGPTIGAAVNLTLLSYRSTCSIGITVDTTAFPDAPFLVDCLRAGFDDVRSARSARTARP